MILRILKSNNLSNLLFIPVAVFAFWAGKIVAPFSYSYFPGEAENVLYSPINKLIGDSPLLNVILSAIIVVVLAVLIELLIARYQFIRIRTRLPAILFALILGGFMGMHTIHPVYFAAIFLLLAVFRLFAIFDQSKAYTSVFDVGFLLGLGALFYLNLFIVVPAFLMGTIVLGRGTGWREFIILILAFLLPALLAYSYYFYTDQTVELHTVFLQNITTSVTTLKNNLFLQIYLGVLALLTLLASIDFAQHYDTKKVSSRKYFMVFFYIFLSSIFSYVLIPSTSQEILVIVAIPVTFLLSNFFVFLKSRIWGELYFALLLVIVIVVQFIG
jgi:4-amino-4-deoxy-L-arabinose transferase-like glycosyltransferase